MAPSKPYSPDGEEHSEHEQPEALLSVTGTENSKTGNSLPCRVPRALPGFTKLFLIQLYLTLSALAVLVAFFLYEYCTRWDSPMLLLVLSIVCIAMAIPIFRAVVAVHARAPKAPARCIFLTNLSMAFALLGALLFLWAAFYQPLNSIGSLTLLAALPSTSLIFCSAWAWRRYFLRSRLVRQAFPPASPPLPPLPPEPIPGGLGVYQTFCLLNVAGSSACVLSLALVGGTVFFLSILASLITAATAAWVLQATTGARISRESLIARSLIWLASLIFLEQLFNSPLWFSAHDYNIRFLVVLWNARPFPPLPMLFVIGAFLWHLARSEELQAVAGSAPGHKMQFLARAFLPVWPPMPALNSASGPAFPEQPSTISTEKKKEESGKGSPWLRKTAAASPRPENCLLPLPSLLFFLVFFLVTGSGLVKNILITLHPGDMEGLLFWNMSPFLLPDALLFCLGLWAAMDFAKATSIAFAKAAAAAFAGATLSLYSLVQIFLLGKRTDFFAGFLALYAAASLAWFIYFLKGARGAALPPSVLRDKGLLCPAPKIPAEIFCFRIFCLLLPAYLSGILATGLFTGTITYGVVAKTLGLVASDVAAPSLPLFAFYEPLILPLLFFPLLCYSVLGKFPIRINAWLTAWIICILVVEGISYGLLLFWGISFDLNKTAFLRADSFLLLCILAAFRWYCEVSPEARRYFGEFEKAAV